MTERLDRFMARANAAYYATHDPFADFTTAPEITQVFGEILGLWAAVTWRRMGSPAPVVLAEAGPGRGTLMRDALRAIGSVAPDFRAALSVHLVEDVAPAAGRPRPRCCLTPSGTSISTRCPAARCSCSPTSSSMPCRSASSFGGPPAGPSASSDPVGFQEQPVCLLAEADDGAVLERCEPALAIAAGLGARFAADRGAALFLDYGPERSAPGDSLQALRDGKPADPLAEPGNADLTAHVDFAALAAAATQAGASVHGPLAQGLFLARLGLFQRTRPSRAHRNRRRGHWQ